MFRLIPNTAISEMESMTLIASRNATKEQEQLMLDIFNQMGLAMLIPEEKIAATTASVEIDKVCTPGGITIKGINELEHEGFTSTVIKAIKASK